MGEEMNQKNLSVALGDCNIAKRGADNTSVLMLTFYIRI
jgi:hypothetical protein